MNINKNDFTFYMFSPLLLLWMLSEYIKAVTNITGLSIIVPLCFYALIGFNLINYKSYAINYRSLFILIVAIILVLIVSISSVIYFPLQFNVKGIVFESIKLFSFLCLLSYSKIFTIKHNNIIIKIIILFLLVNCAVLLAQLTISVDVVRWIGMNYGMEAHFIRDTRPTGITNSSNTIGAFAVFSFISAVILINEKSGKYYLNSRRMLVLSVLCIILSTSKQAFAAMIIIFAFLNGITLKKTFQSMALLCLLLFSFIEGNVYGVADKMSQYTYMISNIGDNFNVIFFENRAIHLLNSIVIVIENCFIGTGLGTWGDYSSTFNSNNAVLYGYTKMSDGYFSHLFVEMGYMTIIYISIIYNSISASELKYNLVLFAITMLMFIPSMGFSVPVFVTGFCLANHFLSVVRGSCNEYK